MGQTLLRLKQLIIGIKQPKKKSISHWSAFQTSMLDLNMNMLDLSEHLSRHLTI